MQDRFRRSLVVILALGGALLALPAMAGTRIEKKLDLSSGGTFRLEADSGSVSIVGGSSEGAKIVVTSRHEDLHKYYDFTFDDSGGAVQVRSEQRGSRLFSWGRSGLPMHFEVRVPTESQIFVDTSGGRIELEGIEGAVDLNTSGSRIAVEDVRGDVNADTSGGRIEISEILGNVKADTSGGTISISSVNGRVTADTSGGGISMSDIKGDIVADTSGASIDIEGAGGSVRADTSGGPVTVEFVAGNDLGGTLSTSGARVTVFVDPSVSLDIDASTSGGAVQCDIPVTIRGSSSKTELRGRLNGGGALLKLRSSGDGIRIESN